MYIGIATRSKPPADVTGVDQRVHQVADEVERERGGEQPHRRGAAGVVEQHHDDEEQHDRRRSAGTCRRARCFQALAPSASTMGCTSAAQLITQVPSADDEAIADEALRWRDGRCGAAARTDRR